MNKATTSDVVYSEPADWSSALLQLPAELEADRRRIEGRKKQHAGHEREQRAAGKRAK